MFVREYRICMPITVDEYKIGQLYMIAKHSAEQSQKGEGVEVVENRPHTDPVKIIALKYYFITFFCASGAW